MKNIKNSVMIVIMIVIIGMAVSITQLYILISHLGDDFSRYAKNESTKVFGKNNTVTVTINDVPRFVNTQKLDSLLEEGKNHYRVLSIKYLLTKEEYFLNNLSLSLMILQRIKFKDDLYLYSSIEKKENTYETYENTPLNLISKELLIQELDSLESSLNRNIVCYLNEVRTFSRKNFNNKEVLYKTYIITVDIDIDDKYSIHENFNVDVYDDKPYPNLNKYYQNIMTKYIIFKKQMCK